MSSSQATAPLAEVDFDAELAALEQEQDVSATQELPDETTKATQEVAPDAKEASGEEAPPSSSQATQALGLPASQEDKEEIKTTQPPSTEVTEEKEEAVVVEEEAPEPAAAAAPSAKSAGKKPLVARKSVAAKKAEDAPTAAGSSAPQKGKLLVKKAKVVEEVEEEDNADAAPSAKPAPASKAPKPCLVKKAAPKAPAATTTKKAPLLPKKKALAAAAPEGPVVKRNKNAYFFFLDENRSKIKDANPGASMGEINKLLGAAYKALSAEEMSTYTAKATEDKARMELEIAAGGVVPARRTKAAANATGAKKKPAVKNQNNSPYDLFCEEQRPNLKKKNPKSGDPELRKLISEAWSQLDEEERAPYMQRSKELKAAAKEAAAAAAEEEEDDEDETSNAASGSKKRSLKTPSRKAAAGTKRRKQAASDDDEDEVMPNAKAGAEDDDEDDVDRENLDWIAHPAFSILSKTKKMYIVARRGLPLHEYGEVPIEAANLQLRAGHAPSSSDAKPCPLTLELLNEYDEFCKEFRRDIFDSSEGNELVLDNLRDGSLLEACSFLGSMKETGHELAAPGKDDIWMKVPLMATSRLMQRCINVERRQNEELKQENEELKAQLAAIKSGSGVGAVKGALEKVAMAEA